MKRKLIPAMIAAFGMTVAAGNASAIVVAGIDFGVQGLTQHIETTTVAETLVNASGQTLTGYGQINTVNGASAGGIGSYCAVDVNCRLFFSFTYTVTAFGATTAAFNNGVINFYYDAAGQTRNLQNFASAGALGNLAYINAKTPWISLTGHAYNSALCGVTQLCAVATSGAGVNAGFTGSGLADVNLAGLGIASAKAYWNGNSESDGLGGFADITLTTSGSSSVLNVNDVCTGQAGQWCINGSADARGKTAVVPEPESLGLLGIGLLGLVAGLRRRRDKVVA